MNLLATYIPFVTPAPVWGFWWVLLFPLVAAVAVVYKTIKVRHMRRLPVEATQLTLTILLAMFLGAAALTIMVRLVLG